MAEEKENQQAPEQKSQDEAQAKAAQAGATEANRHSDQSDDVLAYGEPIDGSGGDQSKGT